ncbi:hypothetical protein J2X65_003202 [Ancylobacter sp. 3268]|uniref:hypothetical protein n=1 Tax=Ancylobacter sp. 3268 TaxID=2817752 RepID=UPI00285FB689|nr:hypothetical protein [Ancylobacter sp. 3268]MDR6953839.1 hypothetical protein [Ancylobacter sp. 3268]
MSAPTPRTWREVFEWPAGEQLTVDQIDARYLRLASLSGRDRPCGSAEAKAELDRAYVEARRELADAEGGAR